MRKLFSPRKAETTKENDQSVCRIEEEFLKKNSHDDRSWRVFRIMAEFVSGFELLRKYGLAVTFFGSARVLPEDPVYKWTKDLAYKLSKDGFTVITGGGGGVMGAGNQGAFEAGGESVGLNIELPHEQALNEYTTEAQSFHYFFIRKVMLSFSSEVYVFMPGGFGTMDEFFEIITLVQTKKIAPIPIILFGKEYWEPLLVWIEEELLKKHKYIDAEDIHLYHLVDSVEEAHKKIQELIDVTNLRA